MTTLIRILLAIAAALAGARFSLSAEAPARALPHTLVRVQLAEGEIANVLRSDFTPVETAATADGLVFTGPPGYKYVTIVSSTGSLQLLYTTIDGTKPDTPDTPDTPDDPDTPDVPTPGPVPNEYGVGQVAFDLGTAVADAVGGKVLAEIYQSAASRYVALQGANHVADFNTTVKWVHDQTRERVATFAKWEAWRVAVATAIQASYDAGNRSKDELAGILNEIGDALGKIK